MTSELRATAEIYRKWKDSDQRTFGDAGKVMAAAMALADAYLTIAPADVEEPVTRDRLIALGGFDDGECHWWASPYGLIAAFSAKWRDIDDDNNESEVGCRVAHCPVDCPTMGHVHKLLAALGLSPA